MIVDKIAAPRNGTVVNDDGEDQLDVYIEVSHNFIIIIIIIIETQEHNISSFVKSVATVG